MSRGGTTHFTSFRVVLVLVASLWAQLVHQSVGALDTSVAVLLAFATSDGFLDILADHYS